MKDVILLTGAGQIGMAIARRIGYGKKIVIGDKKPENAESIAKIMNEAGFDAEAMEMDLSSRESILAMIAEGKKYGEIANVAELLMSEKGAFITGSDFLIDGGATASYFYGPLKPQN